MTNPHDITKAFEQKLSDYTNAPYVVCVDNQSNALFLALIYVGIKGKEISIPSHTYPSVPAEIIHAGGKVKFLNSSPILQGEYQLGDTIVWDSALRFTCDMYQKGMMQCISFTGAYKHLKLGKGGAILTDDKNAYEWFKKARFSGRSECSYHEDNFDDNPVLGWNFYMPVETSARGLHMMPQFYTQDGQKKHNLDLSLPYPNLSTFDIYK